MVIGFAVVKWDQIVSGYGLIPSYVVSEKGYCYHAKVSRLLSLGGQ